jgi:hypothetical protein
VNIAEREPFGHEQFSCRLALDVFRLASDGQPGPRVEWRRRSEKEVVRFDVAAKCPDAARENESDLSAALDDAERDSISARSRTHSPKSGSVGTVRR